MDEGKHANNAIPRLQRSSNRRPGWLAGAGVPSVVLGGVADDSSLLVVYHPAYQPFFDYHVDLDVLHVLNLPVFDDQTLGDIALIIEYV